jgi:hypothetical protein
MTKAKRTQDMGHEAVDRLKNWIASTPEIPLYKGRPNKAEICRLIGISRSTADTNQRIRGLLKELERCPVLNAKGIAFPERDFVQVGFQSTPQSTTLRNHELRKSLAFEHLLNTGRVVR